MRKTLMFIAVYFLFCCLACCEDAGDDPGGWGPGQADQPTRQALPSTTLRHQGKSKVGQFTCQASQLPLFVANV